MQPTLTSSNNHKTKHSSRYIATKALLKVLPKHEKGISITEALSNLPNLVSPKDLGLVHEIIFGVCRWYNQLLSICDFFLKTPLKAKDQDIKILILVGIYQLLYLRTPDHAAITTTVNTARELKKSWAVKLINAVLRQTQRLTAQNLLQIKEQDLATQYAHPLWFCQQLQQDWPNQWQSILENSNQPGPCTLRVNHNKISREDYQKLLSQQHIKSEKTNFSPVGLRLKKSLPINLLPHFEDGYCSIQDEASQLTTTLFKPQPGARVLDACAAPGGKSAAILEQFPNIHLTALEKNTNRYQLLLNNLTRLSLSANPKLTDALDITTWWDRRQFDVILIDAPCSATGIIRRQPDIKWHRKPKDVTQITTTQSNLLHALWPCLKPGGSLIYSTCSILKQENDDVIQQFLNLHQDAWVNKLNTDWGIPSLHGRQILPGMEQQDGFYYAKITKRL